MTVLLVEPGKAPQIVDIEDSLAAMQAVVGGCIQAVYPFAEPVALICNEEGKILGLPLNRGLYHSESGTLYDIIVGSFFLCAAPSDSDCFESLSHARLARYCQQYRYPEFFLVEGDDGSSL